MSGYLNTVIVTVVVCQIAQLIVHNTESYKRIVHILCALVLLLTIAKPIAWIAQNFDRISEAVSKWGTEESIEDASEDPLYGTAQGIMEHAVRTYGWNPEGLKVTLVTDEDTGELREIQLYPEQCAWSDRVKAGEELTKIYGIPVYIYNQRE